MAKRRPWTSGFCAPRMPADSHRRCHGAYLELTCSCPCHPQPANHCPTCTCMEEQ